MKPLLVMVKPDMSGKLAREEFESAIREGDAKLIELLYEFKADVADAFKINFPPPVSVFARGGADVVSVTKLLLRLRADPNVMVVGPFLSCAPLHISFKDGEDELVELLLQHRADHRALDGGGNTVLHCAAQSGKATCVERANTLGCAVDQKNFYGESAVFAAARSNCSLAEFLIDKLNARVDFVNNEGVSLLHCAVEGNNRRDGGVELMRKLIAKGCSIESKSAKGATPLFHAIQGDRSLAVIFVQEFKANVNVADISGLTPLHLACRGKKDEEWPGLVRVLVEAKANLEAIELINGDTPLLTAARSRCFQVMTMLVESYHASIKAVDKHNNTILHIIAHYFDMDEARWCVRKGVNRAALNAKGETAAQVATREGHDSLTSYLEGRHELSRLDGFGKMRDAV